MPTNKKITHGRIAGGAILSSKVKSHAFDPVVLKKAAEAKDDLSKITFPLVIEQAK